MSNIKPIDVELIVIGAGPTGVEMAGAMLAILAVGNLAAVL